LLDAAPDPRSTSETAARRGQDDSAACGAATVVTAAEIERARSVIDGRAHVTPVFTSRLLSEVAGAPIVLKAELFQRTGSFKLRGVLTRLAGLSSAERQRGVITVSAGNHAQALAYGCAEEGIYCLVVMWRGATMAKAAAVRACGASIDLESADPTEAFGRMETIQRQSGRLPIHPFSDPLVVAGQGTVGLEIAEQVPNVATVLVPTGGGGLVSGVAVALRARSPSARVVAVEPQDAAALALGLEAGRPVPLTSDLDAAAYRVVHEALMTTLEHSEGATASVIVRFERDELQVEVTDDGVGLSDDDADEQTAGLRAVRDEVAVLGGSLDAGPGPDGGYWVLARLPYEPDWD